MILIYLNNSPFKSIVNLDVLRGDSVIYMLFFISGWSLLRKKLRALIAIAPDCNSAVEDDLAQSRSRLRRDSGQGRERPSAGSGHGREDISNMGIRVDSKIGGRMP